MKKLLPIIIGVIVYQVINFIGMQFFEREVLLFLEVFLFVILLSVFWLFNSKTRRS